MAKKTKWVQLKSEQGEYGTHIPCGKETISRFFISETMNYYYPIVVFYNIETGEIKSFLKTMVDQIGINNLKL